MYRVDHSIELTDDWGRLQTDARHVVRALLPSWSSLPSDQIQVDKMSGGITNVLAKLVPPPDSGLEPVALRVFGDNTDALIDRRRELEVLLHLNAAGFGAPVLGSFANGRVEQFIPYRPLETRELAEPHMAAAIARRLSQLHAAQVPGEQHAQIFSKLCSWLKDARQLRMPNEEQQRRFTAVDLAALEREVSEVQAACEAAGSPIVCSHNDLLAGNVMVPLQANSSMRHGDGAAVQFIDFEYSCPMQRGFDWGNHFNEYAGFECDYGRYPDAQQASHFLWHYLHEADGHEPTDEGVQRAVAEANLFALASHQFWGTWAFFQAAYSPIDFDYLEYAELRWSEYRRRKDEFMQPFCHSMSKSPS